MTHRKLAQLAGAAMLASLAGCTNMLLPQNVTPVVAPTTSVAEAERKLASVAVQTAAIEAEFAASERACYEKFFVNSCLDAAREKRRSALAYQKAIDIEARYFVRKDTADTRDREVAKAVKEFELEEARAAAEPVKPPPVPVAAPSKPGRPTLQERRAAQDAKLARRAAQLKAEAPERARKEREFEQRRIDSERRQKEVAERLARRQGKQDDAAGTAASGTDAKAAPVKPAPPAK